MLARMSGAGAENGPVDAKSTLRRRVGDVWARVDRPAVAAAIRPAVLALPEVAAAGTVAAYAALPSELPTDELLAALAGRGTVLLLPVVLGDGALGWRQWAPGQPLESGPLGTVQPGAAAAGADLAQAQVVVVPGLAFDVSGGRLGRGGGSFDRALDRLPPTVTVVAMAPDEVVLDRVPMLPHDRPVDVIVTPTRVLRPARPAGRLD